MVWYYDTGSASSDYDWCCNLFLLLFWQIGCCLALDAEVNATVSASLPLSQCGVMHCPPFSSAPAVYAVPLMMTLGTLFAIVLQSP